MSSLNPSQANFGQSVGKKSALAIISDVFPLAPTYRSMPMQQGNLLGEYTQFPFAIRTAPETNLYIIRDVKIRCASQKKTVWNSFCSVVKKRKKA